MRQTLLLLSLLSFAGLGCETGTRVGKPLYQDPLQSVSARVEDLLSRMTLAEKIQQIQCVWPQASSKKHRGKGILDSKGDFSADGARRVLWQGIGQIARPSEHKDVASGVRFVNAIQRYLMENTRLGVPALIHEEGLHGHMAPGATSFPQALALSCTWDPALVERVFAVVATEMRARGAQQALTPVLDVARDPRWGRCEETYGEDPFLVARMGVACIRGFQGEPAPPHTRLAPDRVIATAKHFVAHGQPDGGHNCAPANFSARKVREVFLPSFEAAVREAGVRSIMAAYNEVDGVPLHANQPLMVDVLRNEWGFGGFVVSDYYAIDQLRTLHHVVADRVAAGHQALRVGVDIELPDPNCYRLAKAVRDGVVAEELIDRAARRILTAKFASGCMDNPLVDVARAERTINSQPHRDLALQAAREAIVLLENRKATLPINAKRTKTIAVIGPNADRVLLGGYTDPKGPGRTITALAGIRTLAKKHKVNVLHAEGCRLIKPDFDVMEDEVELTPAKDDTPRIEAAVRVAEQADVTVLVLGGNEATCREGWSGVHLGDRDSIDLLGRQQELFDKIHAVGKPVVVVLIGGRPWTIGRIAEQAHAILLGFYLGQEGGTALAEVLFGDTNPSGKLSITFPRSVGQIPAHYSQKPSARRGYLFTKQEPLFCFGHGLSYTTFKLGKPRLNRPAMRVGETAKVSVDVRNTGKRTGTEVVQLYIRDKVSRVTRPTLELRGFQRVTLGKGQRRTIEFELTPKLLAGLNLRNEREVEPGEFEVFVGTSSASLQSTTLLVTAR